MTTAGAYHRFAQKAATKWVTEETNPNRIAQSGGLDAHPGRQILRQAFRAGVDWALRRVDSTLRRKSFQAAEANMLDSLDGFDVCSTAQWTGALHTAFVLGAASVDEVLGRVVPELTVERDRSFTFKNGPAFAALDWSDEDEELIAEKVGEVIRAALDKLSSKKLQLSPHVTYQAKIGRREVLFQYDYRRLELTVGLREDFE